MAKDPTDPGFLFPDDPDRGDGDLPPGYVPPGDKDAESDGGDSGDGPFPPNDNFCRPHAGHVSRLSYQLQFAANRNVTFGQSVYALHDDDGDSAPWSDLRVGGVVLVKRVSGKDARKPTITLDLATNSPELEDLIRIEWKEDCQTLAVRVPNRIHWASASLAAVTGKKQAHGESTEPARPCVEMRVTINVPKGAELEALWLATVHLGVRLFEDVDLTVHSGTVISTIVGSIAGAYVPNPAAGPRAISAEDPELSSVTASDSRLISANRATLGLQLAGTTSSLVSRDISVSSIAGRIWGTWPLYDSLRIASKSGSVHIDVLPQMVNPDNVKPAYLWVQSYSGDVVIKEPGVGAEDGDSDTVGRFLEASSKLPARDYIVDVSSISGSIKLHVAASSAATITSSAGAVTAVLLPVLDEALGWDGNEKTAPWLSPSTAAAGAGGVGPGRPLIETSTHAGSMELEILEPRWVSADELKGESVPPPAHDSPPASLPDNSVPFLPIGDDDPYSWLPGVADRSVHATHGTTADTESHARTASDAPVSPDGPAARLVPPSPAPEPNDPVGRRSALLLACLTTRHEAAAGNIQLRYPNAWRGDLGASTSVGSLKVRGKGVQVVRRGGGIGKLWLVARKGSEEDFGDGRGSVADVRLFSGNMEVLIGKEE